MRLPMYNTRRARAYAPPAMTSFACAACGKVGNPKVIRQSKTPLIGETFGPDASGEKLRTCYIHGWQRGRCMDPEQRTEAFHTAVRQNQPGMWRTLVRRSREAGYEVRTAQLPRA